MSLALSEQSTVVGPLAEFWQTRCGLRDARVVAWSGDNPCSLIGTGLVREGRVAISLGTSDTIFGLMREPRVDPSGTGHVFGAPTGDYMSLTVFKNGSASELLSAGASLADFNLEFSRADDYLASSTETHSSLFQFNAFHWEPGNSDDLGDQNPLLLKTRILSNGDQGAKSLYVLMHVVRVTSAGYTRINASDLS